MTLYEFISEQRKALDDFNADYIIHHNSEPELYPLEMESGDWDEQLQLWIER